MVLQANEQYGARSFLYGRAKPGEKVVAKFDPVYRGASYHAVADAEGRWDLQLDPHSGKSNFTVTVSGETGPPLVAKNVMLGDVFFCSGQSNTVFPTGLAYNPAQEIKTLLTDYRVAHFRFLFHDSAVQHQ